MRHPLAALAALTNTCRWPGFDWSLDGSSTAHAMCRLRAWSIDTTVNRTSGLPGRLSATWISLPRSPCLPESRNLRSPFASGVPMFRTRSHLLVAFGTASPAAWKTLPVCWSIAG